MLRPPDSSQSARLQGGNARRRGPFEKKIWVNATVQGLEDVQNDVFLSVRAASTFIKFVTSEVGGHNTASGNVANFRMRLGSKTAAKLIRFYSYHCACARQLVPCPSQLRPAYPTTILIFWIFYILFLPDGGAQRSKLRQHSVCVRDRNSRAKRK